MSDEFEVVYACESAAGFMFRVDEIRYRFEKHQLIVTDETEAEAIDACLKKYPTIGRKVKKVELATAEALVQNHKATHGGAHSGPFSSAAMSQLEPNKLGQRDAALDLMGEDSKAKLVEASATDASLILTEKVDTKPVETPAPALVETPAIKPVSILNKAN